METKGKTERPELPDCREQTDLLDLLGIQVPWGPKEKKEILEFVGLLESLVSDRMDLMGFQVQTGCRGNSEKSELLEREAKEVQLVLPVLRALGDLLLFIKAKTCVPTPARPVCTDTPDSPA